MARMPKPCRACGHTEVEQHVYPLLALDGPADREGVFTTCVGCGNRRGSWERKKRSS